MRKKRQREQYPPNPPNDKCHFAKINGVLISIYPIKKQDEITPLFEIGPEKALIWSHSEINHASLVVDVNKSVHELNVWRNLASIIEISMALSSHFEHMITCDYDWIYNFDPSKSVLDSDFLNHGVPDRLSGTIYRVDDLLGVSQILELLYRDEKFYVMCMNLLSAFLNHHYCLICAFQKDGYKMHPNHDIPHWQRANAIPNMEVAIVQSTRAVEAVLGKPGNREKRSSYQRVLDRWNDAIDIKPDDIYVVANQSFIDYFYYLFNIRGDAAHSLGDFPYDVSRRLTIEAQCFAWEVIYSYYHKNKIDKESAIESIKFNKELINNTKR